MKRSARKSVLYELITRTPEPRRAARLRLPQWWSRSANEAEPPRAGVERFPPETPEPPSQEAPLPESSLPAELRQPEPPYEARLPEPPAPEPASPQPAAVGAPLPQPQVREPRTDSLDAGDAESSYVRVREGRMEMVLYPTGGIVAAAAVVLIALVSFTAGRRSAASPYPGDSAPPITARMPAGEPGGEWSRPPESATSAGDRAASRVTSFDPLDELVRGPAAASGKSNRASGAAAAANQELKYLWIQSIRAETSARLAAAKQDAAGIRQFLSRENVPTTLSVVKNGVIIKSAEGFSAGDGAASERDAFKRRVERLGRLYRKQGGQYAFNGCMWQ